MREQQVVLEHDADRPALRGHERGLRGVVEHRRRRARCARRRSRSRPARQRSIVDLPAPFGPSTATVSPGSVGGGRRRGASVPQAARRTRAVERHPRRRVRHRSQRSRSTTSTPNETATSSRLSTIASSGFDLELEVDRRAAAVCVRAGEVAGEGDRRPELAERAGPREHGAGDQRGPGCRDRDATERVPAATRRACARRPRSGRRAGGSAASTVSTRNGMATKVWATIDAGGA